MFEIAPHLKALFPFKDEALSEENELLKKHALQVMQTVDSAVTLLLSGDIKTLQETLIDLGVVHNLNNVKPEHFAVRTSSHFTREIFLLITILNLCCAKDLLFSMITCVQNSYFITRQASLVYSSLNYNNKDTTTIK